MELVYEMMTKQVKKPVKESASHIVISSKKKNQKRIYNSIYLFNFNLIGTVMIILHIKGTEHQWHTFIRFIFTKLI